MSPFSLMLVGIVVLLTAGMADVATIFAARQLASNAGDMAALAAADAATWLNDGDPTETASRLAELNGAELVSCDCEEGSSQVTVTVAARPRAKFVTAWFDVQVSVTRRATIDGWVPSWSP